jgi:hypothetical protein
MPTLPIPKNDFPRPIPGSLIDSQKGSPTPVRPFLARVLPQPKCSQSTEVFCPRRSSGRTQILKNRAEQVCDEKPSVPDERRAPEDDAAQLADFTASCWVVCYTDLILSKPRRNDICHHETCRDQRPRDAERLDHPLSLVRSSDTDKQPGRHADRLLMTTSEAVVISRL